MLGLFGGVGGVRGGDYDVEGALQDGGKGDAFDAGEGEEGDGFFEAEDDAGGEEVEVTWGEGRVLVGDGWRMVWEMGCDGRLRTFFAASEGFGVEGFLAFAVGLWDFAGEFALVGQDELLAQTCHVMVQFSAHDVDKSIVLTAV